MEEAATTKKAKTQVVKIRSKAGNAKMEQFMAEMRQRQAQYRREME